MKKLLLFFFLFSSVHLLASPKVVVLGFDGADPNLVQKYIQEGSLPNIEKLSKTGTFSELEVANPPQTPVSWGVFMTSWNPGRNEVFDFLRRDPNTYKPSFALNEEGKKRFLLGRFNPFAASFLGFALCLLVGIFLGNFFKRKKIIFALGFAVFGIFEAVFLYRFVSDNIPSQIPYAINHLKGKSFWEIAADKGVKSVVIRHPDTFPAKPFKEGRLLSGLGVPDLRGRIGTPAIITTDYSLKMRDNEFSVEIVPVSSNVYEEKVEVNIPGPYNKPFYSYPLSEYEDGCIDDELKDNLRKEEKRELEKKGVSEIVYFPVSLKVDTVKNNCQIEVSNQKFELKEKEWSDWIEVNFKFSKIVKIKGLVRFYLMQTKPELRLYISPIQIHPDNNLHISYPESYAKELFKRFGPYKTMGWAVDTWTISSGLSDEEQFLSDMYKTEEAYERIMVQLLKDGDCDLYVQIYEFTDRIAHILWRYMDEKHPLYDAKNAQKYQEELKKSYIYMDKIIGEAMEIIPKDCTLIVLSDHGFASFRKEVNYNRWLVDNGLMTLKEDTGLMSLYDLFDDNRLLFKNVDWSKTKAYALGLGNIYINLKGREKEGIVEEGKEYEEVVQKIVEELPKIVDPETNEHPVCKVYRREEIYKNFDKNLVPDLRVSNNPGYRVSWQTSLGGVPDDLITPNMKPWSGDHCSLDPQWVKGMIISNRKLGANPNIIDVAPSVLSLLKVNPDGMEGKVFEIK